MEPTEVTIVIPVYRPQLTADERLSIGHNVACLHRYPVVLLAPEGMPLDDVLTAFPEDRMPEVMTVGEEWLGAKNGIAGYNRMMLSAEFYDRFSQSSYLLVCQPDVWIFRDELADWCREGYDYVGAPWIRRPVYDLPVVRHYLALRRWWADRRGVRLRQHCFERVGNGGLSLRHVVRFGSACRRYAAEIEACLSHPGHLHNEDVFWALVPRGFRYPDAQRALDFAFDTNPAACLKRTGGRLPFGCHGWTKARYRTFWQRFIPCEPR